MKANRQTRKNLVSFIFAFIILIINYILIYESFYKYWGTGKILPVSIVFLMTAIVLFCILKLVCFIFVVDEYKKKKDNIVNSILEGLDSEKKLLNEDVIITILALEFILLSSPLIVTYRLIISSIEHYIED